MCPSMYACLCACVPVWVFVRLFLIVCLCEWEDLCTFIQYLVIRKWYARTCNHIKSFRVFWMVKCLNECVCAINICTYISSDGDTATLYKISMNGPNMRKDQENEEKMYTKLVWTYTRIRTRTRQSGYFAWIVWTWMNLLHECDGGSILCVSGVRSNRLWDV